MAKGLNDPASQGPTTSGHTHVAIQRRSSDADAHRPPRSPLASAAARAPSGFENSDSPVGPRKLKNKVLALPRALQGIDNVVVFPREPLGFGGHADFLNREVRASSPPHARAFGSDTDPAKIKNKVLTVPRKPDQRLRLRLRVPRARLPEHDSEYHSRRDVQEGSDPAKTWMHKI